MASIKALACRRMKSVTLPILFDPTKGAEGLRDALNDLCEKAEEAARTDQNVLILSLIQILQPTATRGNVPKTNNSAPRMAATATSKPVINLESTSN